MRFVSFQLSGSARAAIMCFACIFGVVSCHHDVGRTVSEEPSHPLDRGLTSVDPKTIEYPGIPKYEGEIVIVLKGVVSLWNPDAPRGTVVHALVPATTAAGIPEHLRFVRWQKGTGTPSGDIAIRPASGNREYALVTGGGLTLNGEDPKDAFRYDRYYLDSLNDPDLETAFYWVTNFDRFCRRPYKKISQLKPLIDIDHGTLSGAPPMDKFAFYNQNEKEDTGDQRYKAPIASGVVWHTRPAPRVETFSLTFPGGATLSFPTSVSFIEIGNWPLEDIQRDIDHKPSGIDRHFDLYDEFFDGKHGEKFHKAEFAGSVYKTRVGPSCAPASMP
jgi:hypothetical protein